MSFLNELKQFFGLGVPAGDTPAPVRSAEPEPAPMPVSSGSLPPTAQQREAMYRFIVEKLAPYANERDNLPVAIRLWVRCATPEDEDRIAVALYAGQPGHFRDELSRHLADQYIRLAPDWQFSWQFVQDALPADATYRQGNLGLEVIRPVNLLDKPLRARLRTLTGQTTEDSYLLDPAVKAEYCIGRGQTVQTASGRVRTNDIAFLDTDDPRFDSQRAEPNLSVSRQHASIRYDAETRRYRLTADAGGLPANGNKTKILHADNTAERADLPGVGYVLSPGDQIELGGEAKLLLELIDP